MSVYRDHGTDNCERKAYVKRAAWHCVIISAYLRRISAPSALGLFLTQRTPRCAEGAEKIRR